MSRLRPVPSGGSDELPRCPAGVCDGSGWIELEDNTAAPCECRQSKIARAASRGMGTGVPKRFRGVSFDRNPISEIDASHLRQVRAFVRDIDLSLDEGRGLWIYGDVGTGKTSLAMLVSLTAERAGRSVAIYPVTRLLSEIKDTYDSQNDGSYMRLFEKLCRVDLLHLDDLGAERRSDWVLEQLYSIINERWQDQRSIVVTSNSNSDLLAEEIGQRTVSRLLEICGEPLPLMGDDMRKRDIA